MNWKYSDMEASAIRALPAAAPPAFDRDDESLVRGRATIAGTTDEIVEALLDIRKRAGVPVEFAVRSYLPMLELGAQLELMQELAEGVAPHV